jgi:hypothetical protein
MFNLARNRSSALCACDDTMSAVIPLARRSCEAKPGAFAPSRPKPARRRQETPSRLSLRAPPPKMPIPIQYKRTPLNFNPQDSATHTKQSTSFFLFDTNQPLLTTSNFTTYTKQSTSSFLFDTNERSPITNPLPINHELLRGFRHAFFIFAPHISL